MPPAQRPTRRSTPHAEGSTHYALDITGRPRLLRRRALLQAALVHLAPARALAPAGTAIAGAGWRSIAIALPVLGGCAAIAGSDPPRVSLAGIESLPGEGLELRFAIALRVQNPGERALDYDGVAVDLQLRGIDFASGVAAVQGRIPRFGEAVIRVPVTVSAGAIVRQAASLGTLLGAGRIDYTLRGRLGGTGPGGGRFSSRGQFDWPGPQRGAAPRRRDVAPAAP